MTTENEECPVVDLGRDDPTRYKRMLDLMRDAGAKHAWSCMVPTGEVSCWILRDYVLLVQRIGNSVEVYTNSETPNTWADTEAWLEKL